MLKNKVNKEIRTALTAIKSKESEVSIAFSLFILKVGLLHLDSFFPTFESNLSVASVIAEFGMLSMLFLAMIKR